MGLEGCGGAGRGEEGKRFKGTHQYSSDLADQPHHIWRGKRPIEIQEFVVLDLLD